MATDESIRDKRNAAQKKLAGYASGWGDEEHSDQVPPTGSPTFIASEWQTLPPSEAERARRNREADYAKLNKNTGTF